MNKVAAVEKAIDILKTALEAGFLRDERTGQAFASEVGDAIDAIQKRLYEISNA